MIIRGGGGGEGEGGEGGGGGKVSKSKTAEYIYSEYENFFIQTHTSIYICLGLPTSTYFYLLLPHLP